MCPRHLYAYERGAARATEKDEAEIRQWMHDDAMAGFYAQQQEDADRRQAEIDEERDRAADAREREEMERREREDRYSWEWP